MGGVGGIRRVGRLNIYTLLYVKLIINKDIGPIV